LVPALQFRKMDVQAALKDGARTTSRGTSLRQVLVVSEIALAAIPMIGAGLLIRSFDRLLQVDPGFHHDHILAMELNKAQLPPAEQSKLSDEQRIGLLRDQSLQYDELIRRIEGLPGIQAAAGVSVLPLDTALRSASRFVVDGQRVAADGNRPVAETRGVSAGYFAAMGIPLRMGRLLEARDYASQNIIVNEALAQKFWPAGDAVGKRIDFCSLAPAPCWTTIVGVVGNVHQYGLEGAPTLDTYGTGGWPAYTIVRTSSDPAAIAREVVGEVHQFDPNLPVSHVMTIDNLLADSLSPRRFSTFLLGLFAALALLLATVGVYAVTSYSVKLRTNEIGVRMALGARPQNIWWLILGAGARLVLAGIVLGLTGGFALSKLISSLLYGVAATDPLSFTAAALLLGFVGLFACYIPARHAMRLQPIVALRQE
jgi:putative ABC transport system permease protein